MVREERVDPAKPSSALVKEVAALLKKGGVAAFPTDTVYGLACSGNSRRGLARLRDLKGAGRESAFILLVGGAEWVGDLVQRVTPLAEELMRRYWPGPLSIVLEASKSVPLEVTGGRDTVAIRLPKCPLCTSLCVELGEPVASTSANLVGEPTAGGADEIARIFENRIDLVLDGGPPRETEASTLVDARGRRPIVLRQGVLSLAADMTAKTNDSGGPNGRG